jgi:DNA-directed RNA polymerase subunit RPC12/RpoP
MKCLRCGTENEVSSRFCGNCGYEFAGKIMPSSLGVPAARACPACGFGNASESQFCERCGSKMISQPISPGSSQAYPIVVKKTSPAWWLLPIFLTWIGGLVAWAIVRETDKSKAMKLLLTGLGLTAFWILVSIAITLASVGTLH